ncbi:hypothetical protein [Bacillus altitudinis]|uniref:hypothetical protein n=1 Tax=Bacillus altitudinis TaxID=293387 RepID=UPI001F6213AF|nr:hypothetical protein [Bacillus altitudinis]
MKFYKVTKPYYALIKAQSKENALKLYTDEVADDEGGLLAEDMYEIDELEAGKLHGRTIGEGGEKLTANEVIDDLASNEEMVLSQDGSLL